MKTLIPGLALGLYTHRIRKYLGAYAAVMGGVDAIAFTGGVGEHSALVTTGILDSAGLVRLAALLERRLRIRIPDGDINAENFDTIRRIQTYVKHRAPG